MIASTPHQKQKTRLAFMRAILRLLQTRTFDQITVTDIANEADYGRWTFYQYFTSKEEAAYETFVYWMDDLDQQVVAAVQGLDSPMREYTSWQLLFAAFYEHQAFLMELQRGADILWHRQAKDYVIEQFSQHLYAGRFRLMEGVRPEIATRLYVSAVMELLEYWSYTPSVGDAKALADELFRFIFNQPPPK
jgi:AcrR family transcriptional regulator